MLVVLVASLYSLSTHSIWCTPPLWSNEYRSAPQRREEEESMERYTTNTSSTSLITTSSHGSRHLNNMRPTYQMSRPSIALRQSLHLPTVHPHGVVHRTLYTLRILHTLHMYCILPLVWMYSNTNSIRRCGRFVNHYVYPPYLVHQHHEQVS